MSQCGPCGRVTPRWSTFFAISEQFPSLAASIAGLPVRSALVCVGPPLFWRDPSLGSLFLRSVAPAEQLVPSSSKRLWSFAVRPPPAQLPLGPGSATIVSSRVMLPSMFRTLALFWVTVEYDTLTLPNDTPIPSPLFACTVVLTIELVPPSMSTPAPKPPKNSPPPTGRKLGPPPAVFWVTRSAKRVTVDEPLPPASE